MIITINGTGGSGKSTIAKRLAEKLGYQHYSMGDWQRAIAQKKGLTITQLGIKEQADPTIDRMIDDKTARLGQTENNFVIDSWLAAHFIPQAIKIFLDGDLAVRAKRITKKRQAESFSDPAEAQKALQQREEANHKRWLEFYNYDYLDKKNYDLILDTTQLALDEVFEKVYNYVK